MEEKKKLTRDKRAQPVQHQLRDSQPDDGPTDRVRGRDDGGRGPVYQWHFGDDDGAEWEADGGGGAAGGAGWGRGFGGCVWGCGVGGWVVGLVGGVEVVVVRGAGRRWGEGMEWSRRGNSSVWLGEGDGKSACVDASVSL